MHQPGAKIGRCHAHWHENQRPPRKGWRKDDKATYMKQPQGDSRGDAERFDNAPSQSNLIVLYRASVSLH
jgi:hypothetical protein